MRLTILKTGISALAPQSGKPLTAEDLDRIARLYNEQPEASRHEAPLAIGQPKPDSSSPAYGWVRSLIREGDRLFAEISDIRSEVVGWFKGGNGARLRVSFTPEMILRQIVVPSDNPPLIPGLPRALQFSNHSVDTTLEFADSLLTDHRQERTSMTNADYTAMLVTLESRIKGLAAVTNSLEEDVRATRIVSVPQLKFNVGAVVKTTEALIKIVAPYSFSEQSPLDQAVDLLNSERSRYPDNNFSMTVIDNHLDTYLSLDVSDFADGGDQLPDSIAKAALPLLEQARSELLRVELVIADARQGGVAIDTPLTREFDDAVNEVRESVDQFTEILKGGPVNLSARERIADAVMYMAIAGV